MSFTESIRSGLGQYATFSGRASRSEFWWFTLFMVLASIVAEIVDRGLLGFDGDFTPVGYAVSLGLLLPSLAVTVRRLHDIGRTGWWLLGYFLVSVLSVVLVAVGFYFSLDADAEFVFSPLGVSLIAGGVMVLLAAFVVWLVMMVKAGDPAPNQYGPPPGQRAGDVPGGPLGFPDPYAPGQPYVQPSDTPQYPPPPPDSRR